MANFKGLNRFSNHKYKAIRCVADNGRKFHSKKELKRYRELQKLEKAGELAFPFIPQMGWPLNDKGDLKYFCDFFVVYNDWSFDVEDVKGYHTDVYKMKKKLFEERYFPIKIKEI
ncbi:MAG: DUF1064 domain-containing protein [Vicingaceae bacterium]